MSRPLGPKMLLCLSIINACDEAEKSARAMNDERDAAAFSKTARKWRCRLEQADVDDDAAEAWLEWTASKDGHESSASLGLTGYSVWHDPDGTYSATASPLYAMSFETLTEREPTRGAAERACEDHARQRGAFAPRDGAA